MAPQVLFTDALMFVVVVVVVVVATQVATLKLCKSLCYLKTFKCPQQHSTVHLSADVVAGIDPQYSLLF